MEKTRELPFIFVPTYFLPRGFAAPQTFGGPQQLALINSLLIPGKTLTDYNDANKFQGTFVLFPYLAAEKKITGDEMMLSVMDDFGGFGIEFRVRSCRKVKNKLSLGLYGERKVRLIRIAQQTPFFKIARVTDVDDYGRDYFEVEGLRRDIRELMQKLIDGGAIQAELVARYANQEDISFFADGLIYATIFMQDDVFKPEELRELFKEISVTRRLRAVFDRFGAKLKEIEEKKAQKRINEKVRENQAEVYRKAFLMEQKKQIEKELGMSSPDGDEGGGKDDWKKRIEEAEMPPEAEKMARNELELYKRNSGHSSEAEVHRRYLEHLCDYPWNKSTEDSLDLINAREVLAKDHYGLAHVNKRIIEQLAVRKLNPGKKGGILCFDGPPGTGKTHCGRAIARAMGRKFARVSLGGIDDEAKIRGHRRTYVGALPGCFVKAMIDVGVKNPVFLLDEIDKVAASVRGDPSGALLEVLDPEQNFAFSDHYLEVSVDFSQVMFICTSNYKQNIMPTLYDRLEIIDFPGYTMQEKVGIAKTFLIPKQLEDNGLTGYGIEFSDDALNAIINQYTEEAGVRSLEREIATALRSRAIRIGKGEPFEKTIVKKELRDVLGIVRFEEQKTADADIPGVVTGLAVTPAGGCTMVIEAIKMPRRGEVGELIITGNLREVMRESVMVAFDCARAYLIKTGYTEDLTAKWDFHLHCDENGIGKEGPSAGSAIALAFISLVAGRRVRNDLAMTGEIILRGKIWPVGGIKHKVLAAHRAGYKHVFIPKRNEKDLPDIPDEVKSGLNIMPAETIDDIVQFALLPR